MRSDFSLNTTPKEKTYDIPGTLLYRRRERQTAVQNTPKKRHLPRSKKEGEKKEGTSHAVVSRPFPILLAEQRADLHKKKNEHI